MKRAAIVALALVLLAGSSAGYYHFVHYTSRTGPFVPIFEKFDLAALPNRTVYFHISDSGPAVMAPGDSFAAIVSQIRLAGRVWNEVATSELRVAYGGLFSAGTPQSTPGIEVLFDEVPPGVLAYGGPTARAELAVNGGGTMFVPITRSIVVLPRDLSQRPSYTEGFFLTLVHELGHALGLQHTLTSSTMSTDVTRATTKARALAPDDVAAISLLYPTRAFQGRTTSISGRVTFAPGEGVHLASVVAAPPGGPAISGLTHPDGSYRIEGLPPGQYYVYVHALPPPELAPAGIVLPVDLTGRSFPASDLFDTQFYPGARSANQATPLSVFAGLPAEGVNFTVQRRSSLPLYGVTTYSFPGSVAVKPAFLNMTGTRRFLVASGTGLVAGGAPAAGLSVSLLGGAPASGVRAYAPAPSFLQVDMDLNPFSGEGPRHLVFSLNDNSYVLPSGLSLVSREPPSISGVAPALDEAGGRVALIGGTNLGADTRILFDGAPAQVRSVDPLSGVLTVVPPTGAPGHRAAVTALNSDGQSSLFVQAAPPTYVYEGVDVAAVALSQTALPAGVESMIEITGVNTNFDSQARVGFGSNDVIATRTFVVSPTRLLANVWVAPSAPAVATTLSVTNGLRVIAQPFGFQIQPMNARLPVLTSQVVDPVTGRASIYSGGAASVTVSNLQPGGAVTLTLNDRPVSLAGVGSNQITFQVPSGLNVGPAVLRLQSGSESSFPVVIAIDQPPPVIAGVSVSLLTGINAAVDPSRAARPGELLSLTVANLAEAEATIAPDRVRIYVGEVEHSVQAVLPGQQPGFHRVQFFLSPNIPSGSYTLMVAIDGRPSLPYLLPVRTP